MLQLIQQLTHEWWSSAPARFRLAISETVILEIGVGDPIASAERLRVVAGLPIFQLTDEVRELSREYQRGLGIPARFAADVLHLAHAVVERVDYLVTWNCAHIANGEVVRRLRRLNATLGRETPLVVTPIELLE